MNTTTKPAAAPARNTLKVRTAVRAGYANEQIQPDVWVRGPRTRSFGDVNMGGEI